ncbi:MAG: hypothetical protein K0U45_05695 [Alphaproteobacteria bacterium]|nr:hypothetical protein [Alphaproteobacteria bacterium]
MPKNYNFDYLIDKIKTANFCQTPYKHIYIEDFFSEEHFLAIQKAAEIVSPIATNDRELIDGIIAKGFKVIKFPGCVIDIDQYVEWHEKGKDKDLLSSATCEGVGMVFRLYEFQTPILEELNHLLASDDFNRAIAEKLDIELEDCLTDNGIQKYLDGYEISPHPDIRGKAATFMVNINPSNESENLNHHTHYLNFKKEFKHVQVFWDGNDLAERAWVPWDWCETVFQQTKNNSIVLFSPSNDTLHGVKADYNHLNTQRTQLYGNIWYKETTQTLSTPQWKSLDIMLSRQHRKEDSRQQRRLKKRDTHFLNRDKI